MHIAFLTLFLGLTSGVQPFELSVSGPVAAVEILLDGAVAQRLSGPPWKGEIDLGSDLAPHELVARALDADGREVARVRQWVNLPRPPAEVEIALEGRAGAPDKVRLSWERLTHDPPIQTSLSLDGREPQVSPAPAAWLGLFNLLPALPARRDGGLLYPLGEMDFDEEHILKEMRAADAVAVAGLQAAAAGHRRAVLLVLGGPFEDRSRFDPAEVRAYLASLGVPLYVWALKDPFPAWEGEAFRDGPKVDLDLQRILWVEGRHLAREVRLAPDVTGFELLAR